MIMMDSFGDIVDKHFEGESWSTPAPPHQELPAELAAIQCTRQAPPGALAVRGCTH